MTCLHPDRRAPQPGSVSPERGSARALLLLMLLLACAAGTRAQERPLKGVVWSAPADFTQAAADLRRMREIGIEAVRTNLIREERLLTVADSLGLRLFQELPVAYLPAAGLQDTLAYARALLEQALERAARHPSARHFGLARLSDTSDPRSAAYFEALMAVMDERGPANTRGYYVTAFFRDDQCASTVDFVLLNTLDDPDPAAALRLWQARHETPAGLAALGTWVWSRAGRGLGVPHSPEAQARYLETHLVALLAHEPVAPAAVFIHRWRDAPSIAERPPEALNSPSNRLYGLFTREREARPARDVVAGIYTGRQTVFAFPGGPERPIDPSGLVLLGWGIIGLVSILYAASPRFRHTVPRYFFAHGFYLESVRGARDIISGTNALLLVIHSLSAGIVGAVVLYALHGSDAFVLLISWMPGGVQVLFLSLLSRPWLLVVLLGAIYAVVTVAWAGWLVVLAGRRRRVTPGQTLMMALWPRWGLLLLMIAALAIRTLPPPQAVQASVVLLVLWLGLTGLAVVRTLIDYAALTRVPPAHALVAGLTSPLPLTLLVLLVLAAMAQPELTFLWHLITRS